MALIDDLLTAFKTARYGEDVRDSIVTLARELWKKCEDSISAAVTFIPHVASNGDLSWTNTKGATNPATVNIAGPQGVSPTVTTSKSGKTTTLTITDKTGAKTATILDGADGTVSFDSLTQAQKESLKGMDALTIAVSQAWSGNNLVLTAHVYMGGRELSDAEVSALGAVKWFKDGSNTSCATGKSTTQAVSGKGVFEARLETGGGTNMSTLARDSITVHVPVNNLTSTSTTDCLSAAQGKILLDKINSLQNEVNTLKGGNS